MEFREKSCVKNEDSHLCRLLFALCIRVCLMQVQKKNYREEKKRATKELLSTITDPSVIVMADWLKVFSSKICIQIFSVLALLIFR